MEDGENDGLKRTCPSNATVCLPGPSSSASTIQVAAERAEAIEVC